MPDQIICQACGIEAPTKYVEFHQNIGMLLMRTRKSIKGYLCKSCIHSQFWKKTMTTLVLGPWGTISLIMAPCFILNNLYRYLGALSMSAPDHNAAVPTVTADVIKKIQPHNAAIVKRLNAKEPLVDIARDIGPRVKVTPGQVVKYVIMMSKQNRQAPTGGLPVQCSAPRPVVPMEPIPVEGMDPVSVEGNDDIGVV